MNKNATPLAATALLDYPAAQAHLGGVSRSMLKTLVGNGDLHALKLGRRTMFRRDELDAFVERRSNVTTA